MSGKKAGIHTTATPKTTRKLIFHECTHLVELSQTDGPMKANIARYIATLALLFVWGFSTEVASGQTKVPLVKPVAAPPIPVKAAKPLPAAPQPEPNTSVSPASHIDNGQPTAAVPIVQAAGKRIPVVSGSHSSGANQQPQTQNATSNSPELLPTNRASILAPVMEPVLQARPQTTPAFQNQQVVPLVSPRSAAASNGFQDFPTRVPAAPRISSSVSTHSPASNSSPKLPDNSSLNTEPTASNAEANSEAIPTINIPSQSEAGQLPNSTTPPDYSFYLGRSDNQESQLPKIGAATIQAKPLTSPNKLPTVVPADNYLGVDQLPLESELDNLELRSRVPGRGVGFKQDAVEPQAIGGMAPPVPTGAGGDCPNCGGTGCSECGMLAGPWSNSVGNNYQDFDQRFDCCGFVPGASEYAILDLLYWTRNQGGIVGTNFGGVRGYDYDFGGRVTLGQRPDRIHGREFTYFGILPLEQQTTQASGAANINARFIPLDGLGVFETSAFFNAVETTQRTETEFHSVAFDRTRYGWDIVKTNIGLRYIYVDDKYSLASENFLGHEGVMGISGRNHLFGGNIGLDLFYDVGQRVSFSWFGKLGGYLNANRTSLDFTNRGVQYIANRDSSAQFAASIDLGVNAHYHINNNARFRLGYSGLWVTGVTTAGANYPQFLTPLAGLSADDESDVFFHGINFGIELFR